MLVAGTDRRRAGGRARARILCATAVALGAVVYSNALDNPFIYDDHVVILENSSLAMLPRLTPIVLHDIKRPLVNLSYAADYAMWNLRPFGFHLTSVLLHLLNVALLFTFARQAADDHDHVSGRTYHRERSLAVAFASAALFAVHPLLTQAVGYVAARADVLCATFLLLTLFAFRRAVITGSRRAMAATVALWVAALLAKETAAVLPPMLACYDWCVLRRYEDGLRARMRRVHLPLVGFMLAAGLVRLLLVGVEYGSEAVWHWHHALVEIDVARQYLALLMVPLGQSIFHPVTSINRIADPRAVFALVWLFALAIVGARLWVRDRLAGFGLLWFAVMQLPAAVLVMLDLGEPMAEQRIYIPGIGMFLFAGCAFGSIWSLARRRLAPRALAGAALAGLIAILGILTVERNEVWGDPVRLWTEATRRAPDIWVTHLMLGQVLQQHDRCEEALQRFRTAIVLKPEQPFAYQKAAECLTTLRRFAQAEPMYEELHRLQPRAARPLVGLGVLAELQGRTAEARRLFEQALAADPADAAARAALEQLGRSSSPDSPSQ